MATEAELLAIPFVFHYKGVAYKISRVVTFGMEAAFADWVYTEAVNNIERMRARYAETQGEVGLNPEQYERAMDRLTDKLAAGEFAWGSTTVTDKANKTWDGVKRLIYFRMMAFPECNPTLDMLDEVFSNPKERERLFKAMNPRPQKAAGNESEKPKEEATPAA